MSGHGHVTPNPDGTKARCGGPGLCPACSREAVQAGDQKYRPYQPVLGDSEHMSTSCGDPTVCPHCALEFARTFAGYTKVILAPVMKPGDTLIIGVSRSLSEQGAADATRRLKYILPEGVTPYIFPEVENMAVIRLGVDKPDTGETGLEGSDML